MFFVCWGIDLFGNKFLIIQKKKKNPKGITNHIYKIFHLVGKMGEAVSLPLPRTESFNLRDFQAEEGNSRRVPSVRTVNLLSYVVPDFKVHVCNGWAFGHLFVLSSSPDSQSVERDSFFIPRSAQIGTAGLLDEASVVVSCVDLKKTDLGLISLPGGPSGGTSSVTRASTNGKAVHAGCCFADANNDSIVGLGGFSSDLQRFVHPGADPFRFRPRTTVPRGGVAAAAANADDGVAGSGFNIAVCSRRVEILAVVFALGESEADLLHASIADADPEDAEVTGIGLFLTWVPFHNLADLRDPVSGIGGGSRVCQHEAIITTPTTKMAGGLRSVVTRRLRRRREIRSCSLLDMENMPYPIKVVGQGVNGGPRMAYLAGDSFAGAGDFQIGRNCARPVSGSVFHGLTFPISSRRRGLCRHWRSVVGLHHR